MQPLSLLAIPVSLFATIPFAWTVAFFRHVGMFAALGDVNPMASARQQATTWTSSNWKALGLISLAGLLFVNFLIVIMLLPQAGRSFLGVENDLSRLGLRLLNPMTLAVALSLTWLILDPLLGAIIRAALLLRLILIDRRRPESLAAKADESRGCCRADNAVRLRRPIANRACPFDAGRFPGCVDQRITVAPIH